VTAVLETAAEETSRTTAGRPPGVHREDAPYDSGPGVREYLYALRHHRWLALGTFLLVLAASVASLYVVDPVYRAEAEVLLRTEESRQLFPRTDDASGNALTRSPGAELVYVQGDAFQRRAVEAAGDDADVEARGAVTSSTPVSSALLFVAEASDATVAREAAQTWAETYVAARHESDTAKTTALRELLIADRDALQAEQEEILEPVAALDEAVAEESDPSQLSLLLEQRSALQRSLVSELDPVQAELRRVSARISGLDVDLRVLEDPQALAYVSSAAELPEGRSNGSLVQSLLVGVVAGLVLAGGAVAAARALHRS
jgi:hypothetical protein